MSGQSTRTAADPYATARDTCYRLLAMRPRTRVELRDTLRRKGIDEDVAEDVLARFDRANLIDDTAFAQSWVRSRHDGAGLAPSAIVAELRRKGVDDETARAAAGEIDDEAQDARARELVRKKLRTAATAEVSDNTLVRRLVAVLARKGYPQELAHRVVREELRESESDLPGELLEAPGD